jgi:hypothetical protein
MNVGVVVTVAMVMQLRDLGYYGIVYITICVYCFGLSRNS